jgi:hypothetical protein
LHYACFVDPFANEIGNGWIGGRAPLIVVSVPARAGFLAVST